MLAQKPTPSSFPPLRRMALPRWTRVKGSMPAGTFWKALSGQLAKNAARAFVVATFGLWEESNGDDERWGCMSRHLSSYGKGPLATWTAERGGHAGVTARDTCGLHTRLGMNGVDRAFLRTCRESSKLRWNAEAGDAMTGCAVGSLCLHNHGFTGVILSSGPEDWVKLLGPSNLPAARQTHQGNSSYHARGFQDTA